MPPDDNNVHREIPHIPQVVETKSIYFECDIVTGQPLEFVNLAVPERVRTLRWGRTTT